MLTVGGVADTMEMLPDIDRLVFRGFDYP